jgi:hypothetical protein
MPYRAATFPDVTAFNARAVGPRDCRRAVVGSAVLGLGSVSAVALMAGTAAVAAAWLVSGTLGGNPAFRAGAPFALQAAGLPRPPRRLADPSDMFGSALASANPAYAPEATREAALTSAVESPVSAPVASALSAPATRQQRNAALTKVPLPSPRPSSVAQIQSKPELVRGFAPAIAPVATVEAHEARLSPAAVREGPTPQQTRSEPKLAVVAPAPAAPVTTGSINAVSKPSLPRLAYNNPDLPSARDSHTAIYDIVAHTVYLPNGERLEAHSGLGRMLDDPRYVSAKARGATPPNTYDLTLRSGLFHGVQAIRLNPVADSRMYGRDGILAHTYMLGPSGQSFGCVSFRDYPEFLHAFLRGEVDRLVVVPHLSEPPSTVRARRDGGDRYAFDIGSAH